MKQMIKKSTREYESWKIDHFKEGELYKKIDAEFLRDTIKYLEARGYKVTKKHATRSK